MPYGIQAIRNVLNLRIGKKLLITEVFVLLIQRQKVHTVIEKE